MISRRINVALPLLLVIIFSVASTNAQDWRAYAKEDVPLSHTLEAQNPRDAWKEVEKAASHFPPSSHSETSGNLPPGDSRTKYIESWLVATADKARAFYTKFPNDSHAQEAKKKELEALWEAIDETYSTNQFPRFFTQANAIVRDSGFDKTNRFSICSFIFMTAVAKRNLLPPNIDVGVELQKDARVAERDFRALGQVSLFSWIADDINAEKTRPMFRQFAASLEKMTADPYTSGFSFRMLEQVLNLQRRAIGQPLLLRFTDLNGREINTETMKGKVMAVVFWGTLYSECITNVLYLDRLYRQNHAKGLEVIGINVDSNSETLKKFISEHEIGWPQYWDGKEMDNQMVQTARVTRAGTILLVDKKGLLHDIHGDENLSVKIEALLAQ